MKYFVISDNIDTLTGLRLAGVDGVIAHSASEVTGAVKAATENEEIAVLMITEQLVPKCPELIYDIKLNRRRPLIVEIPDRHGAGRTKGSIIRYVREAIGVKI